MRVHVVVARNEAIAHMSSEFEMRQYSSIMTDRQKCSLGPDFGKNSLRGFLYEELPCRGSL